MGIRLLGSRRVLYMSRPGLAPGSVHMEPTPRIELGLLRYEGSAYTSMMRALVREMGVEPTRPGWKPGVLP